MELCIIGNGFDLAHGTPSSYYSFRDYVKAKDRKLFDTIKQFIHIDDFWGDFEGNLSRLSRETIMICVDTMADMMIDCYDESNDDFSYADFYVALELGTETISTIVNNIHQDFRRWIETLCPGNRHTCPLTLRGNTSTSTTLSSWRHCMVSLRKTSCISMETAGTRIPLWS